MLESMAAWRSVQMEQRRLVLSLLGACTAAGLGAVGLRSSQEMEPTYKAPGMEPAFTPDRPWRMETRSLVLGCSAERHPWASFYNAEWLMPPPHLLEGPPDTSKEPPRASSCWSQHNNHYKHQMIEMYPLDGATGTDHGLRLMTE